MRRVRLTLWVLIVVATIAAGALSSSLDMSPRPAAGLAVAASSIALAVASLLAVRILVVTGRPQFPAPQPTKEPHRGRH